MKHQSLRTVVIHEPDGAKDTGLVNKDGHPIYVTPEPIGFKQPEEEDGEQPETT